MNGADVEVTDPRSRFIWAQFITGMALKMGRLPAQLCPPEPFVRKFTVMSIHRYFYERYFLSTMNTFRQVCTPRRTG